MKTPTNNLLALILVVFVIGCKPSNKADSSADADEDLPEYVEYNNPPADGFNVEGSDPIAIMLADQVMNAMGGRAKWDQTNVIYWNFMGGRTLLWDKAQNRVRIDMPAKETVIALRMSDMTGTVWKKGQKMEDPDSVDYYLNRGREMWINDSYWLVMPFKLKDTGVTLKYAREDTTMAGERSDVLRLTFDSVGVTPQNAYEVWVNTGSKLITQWAWYKEAGQQSPNFVLPWTNYQSYDGLLLSGDRGDRRLTDIRVMEKAPESAFTDPSPLRFSN